MKRPAALATGSIPCNLTSAKAVIGAQIHGLARLTDYNGRYTSLTTVIERLCL